MLPYSYIIISFDFYYKDENLNESSSVEQKKKTSSLESKPLQHKQEKIKSKTNNTAVKGKIKCVKK